MAWRERKENCHGKHHKRLNRVSTLSKQTPNCNQSLNIWGIFDNNKDFIHLHCLSSTMNFQAPYFTNHLKKTKEQNLSVVFSLRGRTAEAKPWQNLCVWPGPTLSNAVITLSYDDHQDQRNKHTEPPVHYISVMTF